jgi:hypothetical protein
MENFPTKQITAYMKHCYSLPRTTIAHPSESCVGVKFAKPDDKVFAPKNASLRELSTQITEVIAMNICPLIPHFSVLARVMDHMGGNKGNKVAGANPAIIRH